MEPNVNTLWSVAERSVAAPVGRIRAELIRLLGQMKFGIAVDQLTLVEAVRGSKVAGGTKAPDRIPVLVRLRFTGPATGDGASTVVVEQQDTWLFPTRRPIDVYSQVFEQVLLGIDDALRRIDPAAGAFAAPRLGPQQQYWQHSSAYSGQLSRAADRFLNAESSGPPRGWRNEGDVVLTTPAGMAVQPAEQVYGMVTVGALVASRPGAMPPALVGQVENLTATLENLLARAGTVPPDVLPPTLWCELPAADIPVVEFLAQQARIREAVAVRTLQVCVTCRLAKVTNPDYIRLRNRRSRFNVLTGSMGAVIGPAGISPFVLIGRLAQLNQLDPEFVCPRCQGMHAESTLITFCPRCGQQCDDSALRSCGKCRFDFRSLARTTDLWQPLPTPEQLGRVRPDPAPAADGTEPAGLTAAPEVATVDAGTPSPPAAPDAWTAPESWAPPSAPAPAWTGAEPTSWAVAGAADESGQAFQGWYPDPRGRHAYRWWDGFAWTEHVADNGFTGVDP